MYSKKCVQRHLISWVLITTLILFGISESLAAEKKLLTWGTTQSTSGFFSFYVFAAKLLNENIPNINVTVRSTAGSIINNRLLEKREIDIGVSDTALIAKRLKGEDPFKGQPYPDLRTLYIHMANPLQFVVSKKSGIKSIYDLEGKLFTPGMLGGGTATMTMAIFDTLGIHPKIRSSGYADALEAMKNEQIVGIGKTGVPDSSIIELAASMDIRILSFSDADQEKILENVPGLGKIVVPAGMYPGVDEFKTFEMQYVDFVRKDFPADIAYEWVKLLWENRAEIKKVNSLFVSDRLIDLTLAGKAGYLHPGVIKLYRELGYTVPKRLIPPEMGE